VVTDAAHESKGLIEADLALRAEIIEEHTADAARLATVLEEEVLVTPALEAGVPIGPERSERRRTLEWKWLASSSKP
jgi:hypothetical protein